ncbi:hypothetical protein ACEN88_13215 [Massilia sp. CT11-108]|uniref:hypothetical protein n=1 Tax=Massilia sp. CT11-108 TaxID=3393900 RepID=UPI0039A494C6
MNKFELPSLTIPELMGSVQVISSVIGGDWVMKKMAHEKRKIEEFKKISENGKHSYLFKPDPHPLIEWALDLEKLLTHARETHEFTPNESILKLYTLGKILERCQHESGLEKLTDRLKQKDSFFSAFFEAEVAAMYSHKGFSVRFIEEGSNRTPDLYVKRADGLDGYVECKCRDLLTERDEKLKKAWDGLQKGILGEFGPQKISFAVFVKSQNDLEIKDVPSLKNFIIEQYKMGGCGKYDRATGDLIYSTDPSGKYQVVVNNWMRPDEEAQQEAFNFFVREEFDHVTMLCDGRVDENDLPFWKRPIVIGMANEKPSDRVSGIVNAFKSAVGQLSKEKPGAIWIRIPDNSWSNEIEKAGEKAVKLLQAEMDGGANTRVNAVVLATRMTHAVNNGEANGLIYNPLYLTIENKNSAKLVDQSFWQHL